MLREIAYMEVAANILFNVIGMLIVAIVVLGIAGIAAALGASFKVFFINGLWALCIVPVLWCYGAFIERNQYKVNPLIVTSDKIPDSFNNYKIVHISDLHLASFKKRKFFLQNIVDEINRQNADIIVFTGDLISFVPEEIDALDSILSQMKAKEGIFSVLGNHDYSIYTKLTETERLEKLELLKQKQCDLGWHLLLNENRTIEHEGEKISLIGVENTSTHEHLPSKGDLNKALQSAEGSYKILLTHDPTHWRKEVVGHTDIDLTLSGHTHSMQLSILGWSPSTLLYKENKGLYTLNDQVIHVNIGLGETVIRSRIGAKPEITLLTLHKN